MSARKIGGNTTNILNCYFSKQFYTLVIRLKIYIWKTKFLPIESIYLVFSLLEMQRRLTQTKLCHKLFYFVWKETSHKPLKAEALQSVHIIDTNCFDECLLFHVITGRNYFLYKFSVLWSKCFKRRHFILHFILVISTITSKIEWTLNDIRIEKIISIPI